MSFGIEAMITFRQEANIDEANQARSCGVRFIHNSFCISSISRVVSIDIIFIYHLQTFLQNIFNA